MNHEIREVHELEDLRALAELFAVVWGRPGEPPISSDILKALVRRGHRYSYWPFGARSVHAERRQTS